MNVGKIRRFDTVDNLNYLTTVGHNCEANRICHQLENPSKMFWVKKAQNFSGDTDLALFSCYCITFTFCLCSSFLTERAEDAPRGLYVVSLFFFFRSQCTWYESWIALLSDRFLCKDQSFSAQWDQGKKRNKSISHKLFIVSIDNWNKWPEFHLRHTIPGNGSHIKWCGYRGYSQWVERVQCWENNEKN